MLPAGKFPADFLLPAFAIIRKTPGMAIFRKIICFMLNSGNCAFSDISLEFGFLSCYFIEQGRWQNRK
jgi:hypothetical protein